MHEPKCCGRLMYQEIQNSNTLLSICKICGKTIKKKVSIKEQTGKDGNAYIELKH